MSCERISPTAWLTAYNRTLSDIPLSLEIFAELQAIIKQTRTAEEIEELEKLKSPEMTPVWEARFKMVNHLLKIYQPKQILEIAAGFSSRGLEMAKDASVEYVEVDLPGLVREKGLIVEKLIAQSKVPAQPNFHLEVGSALNLQDLLAATRFFAAKPIAIVSEGFLTYLSLDEKEAFGKNIRTILERFGGVWIIPDVPIQPLNLGISAEALKERAAKFGALTGIDLLKNFFENEASARTFFESLGFRVERHSVMDVMHELVSFQLGNPAHEQLEKVIGQGVAFVCALK